MAKWTRPEDGLPECDCGDRVIGIVRYREIGQAKIHPHALVFVATEDGWSDVEDQGYSIGDCELWTLEKDLVRIVDVI